MVSWSRPEFIYYYSNYFWYLSNDSSPRVKPPVNRLWHVTDESFEIVQYLRYRMDPSSTNANPSAAKRQRTDDGPVLHPKRSEPWFQDGNIILEAGLTQFKVYRGILALNSDIFRDMFAVSQPVEQESVDGCPIVHLSDSPDDVRYVLNALCNASRRWKYVSPLWYAN